MTHLIKSPDESYRFRKLILFFKYFSFSISICVVLSKFFISISIAQNNEIETYFQDFHNSEVTHTDVSKDGDWFFSADRSGKILMWNTNDFTVHKTLVEGNGVPINSMRLNPSSDRLIYSTGLYGMPQIGKAANYRSLWFSHIDDFSKDATKDTLYIVPILPDGKNEVGKIPGAIDVQGHSDEHHLIFTKYGKESRLEVYNENGLLHKHPISYNVGQAIYHEEMNLFAVAAKKEADSNYDFQNSYKLEIRTANEFQLIKEKTFGNNPITDLRFHPLRKELFIVVHNKLSETIEVYLYNLENNEVTEFASFEYLENKNLSTSEITSTKIYFHNQAQIIVNNRFRKTVVITYNRESGFAKSVIPDQNRELQWFHEGEYLPILQQMVLFEGMQQMQAPELHVYDVRRERYLDRYHKKELPKTSAEFLYDGGLTVTTESRIRSNESFFKYYPEGSLMNRFSRISLPEYIQLKHKLKVSEVEFPVDKETGTLAFSAYDDTTLSFAYYFYDLKLDSVQYFAPALKSSEYTSLSQISNKKTRVILLREVPGGGYATVGADFVNISDGSFLKAHLSGDGDYVLTYSENQEIEINDTKTNKLLFTHPLPDETYHVDIHPMSDGFWVSYKTALSGEFYSKSLAISKDGGATFKVIEPEYSDIFFEDFAQSNDFFAVLEGSNGFIFLNDGRKFQLEAGVMAENVSINKDQSRLIVSVDDGTVRIYNLDNLEEVARMIHPNRQSQVIIDSEGYFSSNTDTKRWLSVRSKDGTPLPFYVSEHLNRPDKILPVFGTPSKEMVEMLRRVSSLRNNRINNQSANKKVGSVPEIKSIDLNGEKNFSVTDKQMLRVTLNLFDSSMDITNLKVWLNGMPINSEFLEMPIEAGKSASISLILQLISGENVIQFQAVNKNGTPSLIQRRIVELKEVKKPDLYLFAVGVSQYSDEAMNLTFADKDAVDMALLYGDSTSVDVNRYKNVFFGEKFSVKNHKKEQRSKTINVYFEKYSPDLKRNILQLDINGRYWLEREPGQEMDYWLWNFENATRKRLELPLIGLEQSLYWKENFLTDPTGRHIIYTDTLNQLNLINIVSNQLQSYNLKGYEYSQIIAYKTGHFIGELSYRNMAELDTDRRFHNIKIHQDSLLITELDIEMEFSTELEAVSADGSMIMVDDYNGMKILYVNEPGHERRLKNLPKSSFDLNYAFTRDNQALVGLQKKRTEDFESEYYVLYEMSLKEFEVDSTVIPASSAHENLNINGGELTIFEASSSKANFESWYGTDKIEVLSRITPSSFENTHVNLLTNQEANHERIIREMNHFFKQAEPEDQIIVFFAGHGLLDADYNYYFAPSDMDFNVPTSTGITYNLITEAMSRSESTRLLLLLDTCHAGDVYDMQTEESKTGRFDSELSRTIISTQRKLYLDSAAEIISMLFNQSSSKNGITVLAASGGAEVAYESSKCSNLKNGAFTSSIISYVNNPSGEVSILGNMIEEENRLPIHLNNRFTEYLNNQVMQLTCNRQIPNIREINHFSDLRLW